MSLSRQLALLSAFALFGAACTTTPVISALDPALGPERTLVEIDGTGRSWSSLYWDAGGASEQQLPSGWLGAYFFTVPIGAALGSHAVQMRNHEGDSNIKTFDVTEAVRFEGPRVDRVSLAYTEFEGADVVNTLLYVQVANADGTAEIRVDGAVVPTVAHRALRNDLFGIETEDLEYPIRHWIAFLAASGRQTVGTTIEVSCTNADGSPSNTVTYTLPADSESIDSDGDDFPDRWELHGYDADGDGTPEVDLPGLGADPHRPDVFIEVDVMEGLENTPDGKVWDAVTKGFAAAPIINPYTDGIGLHLDASGSLPFSETVDLDEADDATNANFYTLKDANFDNASRGRIYHYCIWANAMPTGYSGVSDVDYSTEEGDFVGPGDDFIVSFDDFNDSFQTVRSMAATFAHELGHGFQQRHGGANHFQKNPTYNSVMSYSWQVRTGFSDDRRMERPIYAPLHYRLDGAVEVDGEVPAGVTSVLPDYSTGMGRRLEEDNLSEPTGMYNGNAVDWNDDGDATDTGIALDIDGDGDTDDILVDFPNWFSLVYSGPRRNGRLGD